MMSELISPINDANQATIHGTAHTVFYIIAHAMLVALLLSPAPTFWRILRKGTTEEFLPFPYILSYAYWSMWPLYLIVGQPHTNQSYTDLFAVYRFGWGLSILYIGIFAMLTTKLNRKIMFAFGPMAIVPVLAIFLIEGMTPYKILGPACVVYGILMYASPLCAGTAYITKSVEYFPLWPCAAGFLNGIVWVIYSCVFPTFDVYITIPNGVGMLLGLLQLYLYYKYRTNLEKSSIVHPCEGIEAIEIKLDKQ